MPYTDLAELIPGSSLTVSEKLEPFREQIAVLDDWRDRLEYSDRKGSGFAAPGGRFSKALLDFALLKEDSDPFRYLTGQIVVELGAGCWHHGYLLASRLRAKSYIGVEPFYADVLLRSIDTLNSVSALSLTHLNYTVTACDMLQLLEAVPDETVSIVACGIENCILPSDRYKQRVAREIGRVLHRRGVFISSQSDLFLPAKPSGTLSFERTEGQKRDRVVWYAGRDT